jgi:hypothetical protein
LGVLGGILALLDTLQVGLIAPIEAGVIDLPYYGTLVLKSKYVLFGRKPIKRMKPFYPRAKAPGVTG